MDAGVNDMKVLGLKREDVLSGWEPFAYGEVVAETKHYYVVKCELQDRQRLIPKDARDYKCEKVKLRGK